ncbi:phage tail protein [Tenacibaculum ovolyticum]|uniref:phage tail protein n=1 Tax=Tenacibaculum ovolyticum TaxID=104270 RepID=UPI00040E98F8|nr:tail fiber protein [Tenacibaculum ovolyticum]
MKQNKETLKEYFETGDKPTQQQFTDLIDSLNTPFIGEIKTVSFQGVPNGWGKCEGQSLNIVEYQELFNVIGKTYGGDGILTFALPDLRGRIPLGVGNNTELSNYTLGQKGGEETHVLTEGEMPSHNHGITNTEQHVQLSTDSAVRETPDIGDVSAVCNYADGLATKKVKTFGLPTNLVDGQAVNINMTILNKGENNPHNNIQPYLAVNYIIALKGRVPFVNSN